MHTLTCKGKVLPFILRNDRIETTQDTTTQVIKRFFYQLIVNIYSGCLSETHGKNLHIDLHLSGV